MNFRSIALIFLFPTLIFCADINDFTAKNANNLKELSKFTNQTDLNSKFYDLYRFVENFYKKEKILYPLNLEFSLKITKGKLNNRRYVIHIPRTCLKGQKQINNLLSFVPYKSIQAKIKKYLALHCNDGGIIYAIDYQDELPNLKVYFDYPKKPNLKLALDSYCWQENGSEKNIENRIYKVIKDYPKKLKEILMSNQLKFFKKLEKFLATNFVLLRDAKNKQAICFLFKNRTNSPEMKDSILGLCKPFMVYKDLKEILNKLDDNNFLSWIQIGKDEINLYVRLGRWFYPRG